MRNATAIGLVAILTPLLAATPATRPAGDTGDQEIARLKLQVQSLRQRLADSEAENSKLQAEVQGYRSNLNVRIVPPTRPYGQTPWYVEPGSSLPPDAVPQGEGNTRHYLIPIQAGH